jgi:hypothetical protein
MSDDQIAARSDSLRTWIGLYAGCLAVFGLAVFLELNYDIHLTVVLYLAIGFFLNRRIGRKLAFHPMYDTIGEVASAKVMSFLFWPFIYFGLLVRLVINAVL